MKTGVVPTTIIRIHITGLLTQGPDIPLRNLRLHDGFPTTFQRERCYQQQGTAHVMLFRRVRGHGCIGAGHREGNWLLLRSSQREGW